MKIILFFIVITLYSDGATKEPISLSNLVKEISDESFLIQKSQKDFQNKRKSFYDKYFMDGNNIFSEVGDNLSSPENLSNGKGCGFLNLRRPCFESQYIVKEIDVDESIKCVNVYGSYYQNPDSYMIQNTIVFQKENVSDSWKIIGNRVGMTYLPYVVFGLIKNKSLDQSFTHRCFDSKKLLEWKERLKEKHLNLHYFRQDGKEGSN